MIVGARFDHGSFTDYPFIIAASPKSPTSLWGFVQKKHLRRIIECIKTRPVLREAYFHGWLWKISKWYETLANLYNKILYQKWCPPRYLRFVRCTRPLPYRHSCTLYFDLLYRLRKQKYFVGDNTRVCMIFTRLKYKNKNNNGYDINYVIPKKTTKSETLKLLRNRTTHYF